MGHCDALRPGTLSSSQRFRLTLFAFFIALVSAILPAVAQAQTDNWINAGTASWFVPGNWSRSIVPTAAINAAVDNGGTAQVVGQNATVGNLMIGATTPGSTVEVTSGTTLTINALTIGPNGTLISDPGSVFTQSGGFVNNGNLVVTDQSVNAGTISGNGTVTKTTTGTVTWQAPLQTGSSIVVNAGTFVDESAAVGNVTVTGTGGVFQVNAGFALNQGATLNNGGTLDNFGNVTGTVDGVNSNLGGGVVTNETSGVITGGTGNGVNFAAGGTVTNLGRITASQFAGIFISGSAGNVTNSGTITGNTAGVFLDAGGTVNNQAGGAISGNGNDAVFVTGGNGTVTNSGTLMGPDGVRFQGAGVTGTVINNAGGVIQGATSQAGLTVGVGTLSGATLNLTNSGTISGPVGVGLDQGGTIINNAGGTITGTSLPAIEITGTGNIVVFSNAGTVNGDVDLGNFSNAITLVTGGTINGSLNAGSATLASLTLDGTGTELISQAVTGTLSGFSSLAKQGTGTWTIDENLVYSGGTTVSAGTLQIGNGGVSGSIAGDIVNNAALTFDRSDNITFSGTISGNGALTQAGSGILTLTGSNTYTGGTTINGGGTLQLGVGGTTGSIFGNVTDNGILAFNRSDPVIFSGVISGAGSVQDLGGGTLTLTANNTYTGSTTINGGGTLQVGAGGTTGSMVGNVTDNGVLTFDRSDTVTFSGVISGAGSVLDLGGGTLMLTGNNTYTGGTTINSGTLQLGAGGTTGSIIGNVTNNDILAFDRSDVVTFNGVISGAGSVQQLGGGTLTLTGNNTYTGGTTINGGTLQLGAGGTTGSIVGNVTDNGILAFDRSDAVTFSGVISGGGSVQQLGGGTLTLTASNTYSGGTTISGGTLQLGAGGTTGSIVGNVTDNGVLSFDRSDAVTFSGVISGAGRILDLGGGTLTLTGNNTYSGGTVADNGKLIAAATNALGTGSVSINNSAQLEINPGVTITNYITLNNSSTLTNEGTLQAPTAPGGPVAAVTTSGGATIDNASGGMIAGFGLIGIQSSSGTATITNSGVISGTEGISLLNGGTITNNAGATISGSNGVAIASSGGSSKLSSAGTINGNVSLGNGANTVQLFSGSRISGSLNLGTSSASNLILDGSSDQTYSQAVTGATTNAGSLTKQGSGNWLIDVAMNAPVSTNILAGALTVNGSLNSPLITVQSGGMLKGSGVIIGNVVNVGTLAPGNSPGTLTINGNFTQGPAGVYNVQIVSAQNYSRLVVNGSANLDGTLRLTLASGFRPAPGESFTVLTAAKGINGSFRTISSNTPVNVTYSNGVVDVSEPSTPKPEIHLSDGTPVSTTALIADNTFYAFGSLAQDMALGLVEEEGAKPNAISLTFDAGEFDVQGQNGKTYTIPIAGAFKINNRVTLDYEIPLQYITFEGTGLMQAGVTLDLPVKVIVPSPDQPWSWVTTPTAAFASSGSKEIIGGGALSNVFAYRWRGITATYGNYISFFEGDVLAENDPRFPTGVNQQIMKNGLKLDIPFGKDWLIEVYGIYTQFFQSAAVSSYVTAGAELGRHFYWNVENQKVDLGYLSFGFYTELGNRYSSGFLQVGSAWRF
ncbi:MAG TPA: autotransporter-associated beta strand repeat-containing protein [Chthoniobacterales bacterium]|nr:autotransporter-associated beta strand repeat-containing protein [Chthoniobacterales bacterium]